MEDYPDPYFVGDNNGRRSITPDQQEINILSSIDQKNLTDKLDQDKNSSLDLMSFYYDTIAFENTVGIVIPCIYSLIIFVGLLGNALVITVVLLNRHMRNSTNILIVNLALADLLFLLFCVPFTAADYALPIWVFSYGWCQVLQYLQFVSAYASVWLLVLMAFDRFLAVCLPVQSLTLRTVRNTLFVSGASWVLIFILNIPHLQIYGIHTYYFIMEDRSSCTFVAQANRTATVFQVQLHHLSFVTFGYLLPLSITCILYFFMLRRLWWGMPSRLGSRVSEESIRAKKKVTWMVSGVIGTFAICWAPLNACFTINAILYRQIGDPWQVTKEFVMIQMASQCLAYANSCLNPILYAFLSENFRKGFFKICGFVLCCCRGPKLEFERTNDFGPNTNIGSRPSTVPQADHTPSRMSLSNTNSRLLTPELRNMSPSTRTRCSLLSQDSNPRGSSGSVSGKNRDPRRRSTPTSFGVNIFRRRGDKESIVNGNSIVLFRNENGKHSIGNPKRDMIAKDVSERLLDVGDVSEAQL